MIAAFLLLVAIFGFGLYYFFFRSESGPSGGQNAPQTGQPGGLPSSGEDSGRNIITPSGQGALEEAERIAGNTRQGTATGASSGGQESIKPLVSAPTKGLKLSEDGKTISYYNSLDGKFYASDSQGKIRSLSDKAFHNVNNVTWSPKGAKAVLEYPDGANIVYDFDTQQQYTLPRHWEDFDFDPTGNQIAAKSIGVDPDNRWLTVTSIDGSRAKPIAQMGGNADRVIVSWSPIKQSLALYVEGESFDRQSVYFVGLNDENFKSLTVEGRGFEQIWNPSGKYMLYSVYSSATDMNPVLWSTRADGEHIGAERKMLNVATWAHKCVFKNELEALCAVPKELEAGSGLLPELAAGKADAIYQVNIQTGAKRKLLDPEANITIASMRYDNAGKTLYVTESANSTILKISL